MSTDGLAASIHLQDHLRGVLRAWVCTHRHVQSIYMLSSCVKPGCLHQINPTRPLANALQIPSTIKQAILLRTHAAQHPTKQSIHVNDLKQQLGQTFPNSLLLEGQQLPELYSSRHFVNLTNGLELAPVLQELELPFGVVRIRSTNLEQQSYEALMLELDANLLLSLALGHSCIIWDCGCRNRHNGAPRAIWYGLEFVRFALNRFWLDRRDPAHLRGHDVSASFEAACRGFHPTTKKRLRYYKRFLSEATQQQGVRLYGMFRKTDRDEDVNFFVDMAVRYCGTHEDQQRHSPAGSSCRKQLQVLGERSSGCLQGVDAVSVQIPSAATSGISEELYAYTKLLSRGLGMFAAGLSHSQYRDLQQQMCQSGNTKSHPERT